MRMIDQKLREKEAELKRMDEIKKQREGQKQLEEQSELARIKKLKEREAEEQKRKF